MTASDAAPAGAGPEGAAPEGAGPQGAGPQSASPESASPESASPESASPESASPDNTGRMPAIYLSHGAPPLADDALWTRQLADWARELPKPKSVLMVSAHWEAAPLALGATSTVPLVYDFWGFPDKYYPVRYPAPGAPELASDVRKLLRAAGTPVEDIPDRGLDHGAYVPLVEMYPDADVPVLQVSMPTLDPEGLFEIGRKLRRPARRGRPDRGQRLLHPQPPGAQPRRPGAARSWPSSTTGASETLARGDLDALLDFEHQAPAARQAHPRTEHFAPLFVTLGASDGDLAGARSVIDGFWLGLAKRSIQVN